MRSDSRGWNCGPGPDAHTRIRLHCAAVIGCPIVGDALYGDGDGTGLHLLARSLSLALTPPVSASAPPPAHMRPALAACGWAA